MKRFRRGLLFSTIACSVVMAGGYKIPEQSLNSVALGAAYVAHTSGADTNYYNPANMSFLNADKSYVEGGVTLAHLPSIDYNLAAPFSGSSEVENIPIPYFHYISKAYGDYRWGVSLTAPAGLTKRWETPAQKAFAEEFTLKVVELNPTIAYKINEQFSAAVGARVIYSEGIVSSNGESLSHLLGSPNYNIARHMEGDTVEFGYNLAFAYKPTDDINVALTYRSNVNLNEEGSAQLWASGTRIYNGDASVSVPLPAALNFSVSKTWEKRFTLELNYERTYWSEYKALDFNYASSIGILTPAFDTPMARDWSDTNTFRIGATIAMENDITFMLGLALDEAPTNEKTIGFELPDSDAKIFSMGVRYKQNENLSWGLAFLYDAKDSTTLAKGVADNPILAKGGSFTGGGAFLTTMGVSYEY